MAVTVTPSTSTTSKTKRDEAAKAAALRIFSAKDVEPHLKLCLYARNKLGKTVYACSSSLKTLVIDFNEHGFDSVRKQENVDIYQVTRWEDLDPLYWYLRSGKHPYEVIVIDTVTMMSSVSIKWVLKDDLERDMTKDPLAASKQTYGKNAEILKDAIIKFRNLPHHIVFNAQEKATTNEDEEGNTEVQVHPELSPAPRSTLLSATNLIGRLYVREVEKKDGKKEMERRILFGAHPKYIAGGRFEEVKRIEILPVGQPNFGRLLDRIYGGSNAGSQ